MSTRSHIRITDSEQSVLLYRHCDGYPTGGNLECIAAADEKMKDWRRNRATKVASMIVVGDPEEIEVLPYTRLHGDIEWLYDLDVSGPMHLGDFPRRWTLKVKTGMLTTTGMDKTVFSGSPREALRVAESLEDARYDD